MNTNEEDVECMKCKVNEIEVSQSKEVAKIWFVRSKVAVTSLSLFVRLTASFIVAAYDGWVRKKYKVVTRIKDKIKIYIISAVSTNFLASLKGIIYKRKIESLLNASNIAYLKPRIKWIQKEIEIYQAEKSVSCDVLYTPLGEIRADVIFIHGLYGSLVRTWKQGLWSYRKNVTNSPIQHKYKIPREKDPEEDTGGRNTSGRRFKKFENSGDDHDEVLEYITDVINNVDDKIKESKGKEKEPEKEHYSPCWPKDWLPQDCPGVRVIALNYTTDPFLWRPLWITKRIRTSMSERSEEMEDHLLKLGVGEHPIVWVGHSKGGLFVKQMLVDGNFYPYSALCEFLRQVIVMWQYSKTPEENSLLLPNNTEDVRLKRFLEQSKGIMFYSVPHRGSSLAHISLPFLRQSVELTEVKKDCREVIHLHNEFLKLYEKSILSAEVYSFVETVLTFMFITNVRVVSVDSADVGFGAFQGVNIDHREICKPLNRDCFLYKELADLINRVV